MIRSILAIRPLVPDALSVRGIWRERKSCISSDGKAEVGVADFIKTAFCVYTSMHACFLRCLTYHSAEETAWLRVVWGSSWLPIGPANLLLHESCLEGLLNGITIFDNLYFIFAVLFASFGAGVRVLLYVDGMHVCFVEILIFFTGINKTMCSSRERDGGW